MIRSNPILKITAALLLVCGVMVFNQCRNKSYDTDGINGFLALFSLKIQGAQKAGLLQDFDMPNKKAAVTHLVNLLCNLSGVEENSKPIFKLEINTDDKDIKSMGKDITMATIAVKFSRDSIEDKKTRLSLKIKKNDKGAYKIVGVDATAFSKDYVAYENLVRSKTLTDKDIYSPETLAAFAVAKTLKGKYDSIPWFQHVDGKTYYYVVKGAMNLQRVYGHDTRPDYRDTTATYKMGLVGPDQTEVIPVDFELIHNIGATIPTLIEVEKGLKRGFYDLNGKLVLPVEYDQLYPLNEENNLAVLRKGNDYYWWKKDYTVSDKDPSIKIAEILPKIAQYGKSMKLDEKAFKNIMEYNSREEHGSIFIPPSYLADWSLMGYLQVFTNPLRKHVDYEEGGRMYELKFDGKTDNASWLSSIYYSITEDYLGGRGGLYTTKNLLVVNKKNNRIYGHDISSYLGEMDSGEELKGPCSGISFKIINDSLYEVKMGATIFRDLYDESTVTGGSEYHYFAFRNDNMIELPASRLFGFTKYIRMDNSYLNGCYELESPKRSTAVTSEMLRYMKNEIYAEYKFTFKDEKWNKVFGLNPEYEKLNTNVDDSLTAIDKYNIAFINKKLAELASKGKVLAAK
jgi:hypothetical protein